MKTIHYLSIIKLLISVAIFNTTVLYSQNAIIVGKVKNDAGEVLSFASINIENDEGAENAVAGTTTNEAGLFHLSIPNGNWTVNVSYLGYQSVQKRVAVAAGDSLFIEFSLKQATTNTEEVVITGTLKPVNRLQSPVPVEVYRTAFFNKNPTNNICQALQTVNGVRPQNNCQVCNTGDIQINGLQGAYTMVLIDGMPIVSSLATVYGLSGIPSSMVEQVEIVKGSASSLYGSEAIGGLINVITKNASDAPMFGADVMATSWAELNADLNAKFSIGKKISVLTGVNYYHYDNPIDNNGDNFTDMSIQQRLSVFQKWSIERENNRLFSLAGRYYWEDRWGGELQWTPADRGSSEVYGEAITTNRWELLGKYELPTTENLMLSFSLNSHHQNSVYGDVPYVATQNVGFGQLTWDKEVGKHDLLAGAALRYTYYDDNTPATGGDFDDPNNNPDAIWLPGVFIQDEITFNEKNKALLGLRYDYNSRHGNIFTPRLAYKFSITENDIIRLNAGTGFRVVNLFTEDHAALTGAREVVIAEALDPEQSYNLNLNYTKRAYLKSGGSAGLEVSAWYTYFTNLILPDYETNPNQIIYDNLDGSAVTQGISANFDWSMPRGWSVMLGATWMDVTSEENGVRARQLLTESFTSTWAISYEFGQGNWTVDYTGSLYGPMLLPRLSDLDPRPEESPWWSIQNIQMTYKGVKHFEFYGGIKNLLNWTPWRNQSEPIIARAFDPFDREVQFDANGNALATPNNPDALTFDPTYVYAPNQGIRGFVGMRYSLR